MLRPLLCLWLLPLPLLAVKVDPRADIHPTAVLLGDITVGPYTRIGPKVVIQGHVTIGSRVNFYGRDWPAWERQATAGELKSYRLP